VVRLSESFCRSHIHDSESRATLGPVPAIRFDSNLLEVYVQIRQLSLQLVFFLLRHTFAMAYV